MDPYLLLLAGSGVLILLVAWLPMVLKELPLSLPMACVAAGYGVFALAGGPYPMPLEHPVIAEHLTELVVIVALTGAGLKLDRPIGWRSWRLTWRMLGLAMPLSILGIALVGGGVLGLGLAACLLLGAMLAPTDPVLAADVQVGPPQTGEEDEVRLTLTAEAGLNDGLAFPFVHLAILAALEAGLTGAALSGWLTFRVPNRAGLSRTGDGFVALGVTFLAYGVTELVHGYGFLAVFLCALALRASERRHKYHERLHDFAEQSERLLMMVILVLFGGAIAGGLLAPVGWREVAAAAAILLVVRPLAGLVSLLGSRRPGDERLAIAFFGIRGLGSFYYAAYALNHAAFAEAERLWAVLGLVVLCSIVLHGTTVTPAIRHLDRRRARWSGAATAVPPRAEPG